MISILDVSVHEREKFEKRFWSKILVGFDDDCWDWIASVGSHGYGQIRLHGVPVLAHRVVYELVRGRIPEGKSLDHRVCRRKVCCNPYHTIICTRGENIRQSDHHVGKNLLKTHCPKGHPYDGDNLYVTSKGHRQCNACRMIRNKNRFWDSTRKTMVCISQ
jgi:hypothetical protein